MVDPGEIPEAQPWPEAEPVAPTRKEPVITRVDPTPPTGREGGSQDAPDPPPRTTPGTTDTGRRPTPDAGGTSAAKVELVDRELGGVTLRMARVPGAPRTLLAARELTTAQLLDWADAHRDERPAAKVLVVLRRTYTNLPRVKPMRTRGARRLSWVREWMEANAPEALERPVRGVSLELAREIAEGLALRLPTEAEWRAAAGFSGRQDAPGAGQAGIEGLRGGWEWLADGRLAGIDEAGRAVARTPDERLVARAGLRLADTER